MAERGVTCLQKQGQRLLPVTAPRLPYEEGRVGLAAGRREGLTIERAGGVGPPETQQQEKRLSGTGQRLLPVTAPRLPYEEGRVGVAAGRREGLTIERAGGVGPQETQRQEKRLSGTVRRREGTQRQGKGGKKYGVEVARMAERGATCLQKQGQRLLPVIALRLP
ncbi:hypothetical protein NDU88_006593 [Pleurodeles waltl]|uniref:Uncharacterized protein n=1 Tax=Pleurodeles waltl TaxID=8319 RepID=A0AAV7MZP1_PLEWA|nr:hypothetical protein NDU88_006593 [Pleurodeles waltl]